MDAEIGIIGGSGFYSLLESPESIEVDTRYGKPSDRISIGRLGSFKVAFLPRHGGRHTLPPHKVPYKANIDALSQLGVERIISTASVGSLKKEFKPGDFVLFDQFFNMTHGRQDTFYDEDKVAHVGMADPYCSEMREIASDTLRELGISYHKNGTTVVVNGPRFSSKAESRFFSRQGFETINMTQYPEVALAREKSLCYLGIGIITDYDVGLEGEEGILPVSADEIISVFGKNVSKAKSLISEILPKLSSERKCKCKDSLEGAFISH